MTVLKIIQRTNSVNLGFNTNAPYVLVIIKVGQVENQKIEFTADLYRSV